jgi:hypothetical protein
VQCELECYFWRACVACQLVFVWYIATGNFQQCAVCTETLACLHMQQLGLLIAALVRSVMLLVIGFRC